MRSDDAIAAVRANVPKYRTLLADLVANPESPR
jgi:hypothetical protein